MCLHLKRDDFYSLTAPGLRSNMNRLQFLQMTSNNSPLEGIAGTGTKIRKIKADDAAINSYFEFNKSINPHGDTAASIFVSKTKKGFALVELYQDLNNDGIIKTKERIYKGKCRDPQPGDELLNFFGDIKLIKTMHKIDWLAQKIPDKLSPVQWNLFQHPMISPLKIRVGMFTISRRLDHIKRLELSRSIS